MLLDALLQYTRDMKEKNESRTSQHFVVLPIILESALTP